MMPQLNKVFQYSTIQKILSLISLTPWEQHHFTEPGYQIPVKGSWRCSITVDFYTHMEAPTAIQKNNCSKNFRKFTPRQPYVSVSTKVYSFATFLRTRCVRNKLENR